MGSVLDSKKSAAKRFAVAWSDSQGQRHFSGEYRQRASAEASALVFENNGMQAVYVLEKRRVVAPAVAVLS